MGFYTRANLTRLWNQVRKGGKPQSCHMTDPSHPDHVKAGAKLTSKAVECPGSLLLIQRELRSMADEKNYIGEGAVKAYLKRRRKGLTRSGLLYWMVQRIQMAGVPIFGGPPMPEVDEDEGVGLPTYLRGESSESVS